MTLENLKNLEKIGQLKSHSTSREEMQRLFEAARRNLADACVGLISCETRFDSAYNWHLIAFCRLRNDWRDFVLGRMTLCSVGVEAFDIRSKEEWLPYLQNTFGIFQNKQSFNVVLKFTSDRSRWIKGEIWHEGQTEDVLEDGSLVRTIPASHEAEIMMEILKHGSHVEVLEPEWLREKVVGELGAATRNYVQSPAFNP